METEGDPMIERDKPDADPLVMEVQEVTNEIFNENTKEMTEETSIDQKKEMVIDGQVECKIDDDKKKSNDDDKTDKTDRENEAPIEIIKVPEINVDHNEYVEINSIIQDFDSSSARTAIVSSTPISQTKRNSKDERHLWIYNINPATTAGQLKLDLSKHGRVLVAKIVTNGDKYFGYALMERTEHVKSCIDKLNKRIVDGFLLEVSADPPNKRKVETPKKECKKEKEKRITPRKFRKRSRSQDPLTLKVRSVRQRSARSDSRSRRRQREREDRAALKKQRELELQIENEKRKLESEKRKLEREKLELQRMQRRLREDRENERRREEQRKKEFSRKRSRSVSARRVKVESTRKRSSTPNIKQNDYRSDYKVNRSGSLTRPKSAYRFDAPPPPPRLTAEDKVDPWKISLDSKKTSRDYYLPEKDRVYQQTDYGERKRFRESSYERKYPEDEKKKRYENKQPSCRSEVYLVSSRNNDQFLSNANDIPRRFENLVYPIQQGRGYSATSVPNFQTVGHMNVPSMPNWNRGAYANVQAKQFHHDHDRYEQYDKRHAYFNSGRKY